MHQHRTTRVSRNARAFVFVLITAVATAVGLTVYAPADAATQPDDCRRVAKADRTLCAKVKAQKPYAYAVSGGLNQVVGGKALVREITHQGLTKPEMHSYLKGEAAAYKRHVTDARTLTVDLGSLRKHYGPDAVYEVTTQGKDDVVSIVE